MTRKAKLYLDPHELRALVEFHMADQEAKSMVWDKAVETYNGQRRDGLTESLADDEAVVRNLAYETGDALASALVPRNAELKITPMRKDLADAAKAQEGLTNETFRRANLEAVMKKAVTLAAINSYSAVKTVWKGKKRRPGYRAVPAKNLFFDPNAESWDEITYIGEITVQSKRELKMRAKRSPERANYKRSVVDAAIGKASRAPSWLTTEGLEAPSSETLNKMHDRVVVVEMIFFNPNGDPPVMVHCVPGIEEPLLQIRWPLRYVENPFTLICLEVGLYKLCGPAPYELIRTQGAALNQLESIRMGVARASIPVPILNKSALQNPEKFLEAFSNVTDPRDMVEIEIATKVPIGDILTFSQTPGTTIDFAQAIGALESRIESTLGIPSYLRGGNSGADFSQELKLQSHELATRAGARRKVINDAHVSIGVKSLQLYAEKLGGDDVVYARATEGEAPMAIGHQVAALTHFADQNGETPLEFDFKVRVVDESSENPIVRLQAIQPFLPTILKLASEGSADAVTVVTKLLRWLGMEDAILASPPGAQQQQAAVAQAADTDVPGVSGVQTSEQPIDASGDTPVTSA